MQKPLVHGCEVDLACSLQFPDPSNLAKQLRWLISTPHLTWPMYLCALFDLHIDHTLLSLTFFTWFPGHYSHSSGSHITQQIIPTLFSHLCQFNFLTYCTRMSQGPVLLPLIFSIHSHSHPFGDLIQSRPSFQMVRLTQTPLSHTPFYQLANPVGSTFQIQLMLEQHRFELRRSSYTQIFKNTVNVFSLPYNNLNNIFFSLVYTLL